MIEREVTLFSHVLSLVADISQVLTKYSFYRGEIIKDGESENYLRINQHNIKQDLENKLD